MGFFLTTGEAGSEEKKFPHESRKAHFIFPTNGLAGVVKKNFPKSGSWLSRRDEIKIPHERRSREWGIFISSQLLSHEWGSKNVP